MTDAPLSVHDLSVVFDGRTVLRSVDLTVADGEFVALLGSNGSGKSTLVRTAIGLVPAHSGSVELFGTPLEAFRSWERLGYVPQRSRAVAGVPATVHEVVMSGRLSRRRHIGWASRADHHAVDDALDRVHLADRASSLLSDLSGGMQQRALIARALAAQAEFLVMDEPTAGVDHENQDSLAGILSGLIDEGTSVLLVAHELGPLRPLIDRAVVVHGGSIGYDGPVSGVVGEDHSHVHHHVDASAPPQAVPGEVVI